MESARESNKAAARERAARAPSGDVPDEVKDKRAVARRPKRPHSFDRRPSPLIAGFFGAVGGFLAGAVFAVGTSGFLFWYGYPAWVWHLLAGTYGLSLGLAGTFRYRGWTLKMLSLFAPPAIAVMVSYVLLMESGQEAVPRYVWFGTMVALTGAVTGLLAGFASRSLGGFAAGIIGGQLIAWPASFVFMAALQSRMPYGVVVPLAFASASGLSHLAIAYALRIVRADLVPEKNMAKPDNRQA